MAPTTVAAAAVAEAAFDAHAVLDRVGFYDALVTAGFPDLRTSHLATFLFDNLATNRVKNTNGITRTTFQAVLQTATRTHRAYHSWAQNTPLDLTTFQTVGVQLLMSPEMDFGEPFQPPTVKSRVPPEPPPPPRYFFGVYNWRRINAQQNNSLDPLLDTEVFERYDRQGKGVLDETDLIILTLCLDIICTAFLTTVLEGEEDAEYDDNRDVMSYTLTREQYPIAMQKLGLPDLQRTFQGQIFDAVFARADADNSGDISLLEFNRSAMRLVYPVSQFVKLKHCPNYPGWNLLRPPPPSSSSSSTTAPGVVSRDVMTRIRERILQLQTGDLVLFQEKDGALGRFANHALQTPWGHVAVVVRRTPLTGIPNEKTEELLCQYPFRRNSHRFCSPGYCRCFDPSPDEFNSSRFSGLQEVGLLESTGEGAHLYDLAHRLLEPGGCGKPWSSIAFVRVRGELPGRNDSTKINPFIEKIRGGIYTVRKDELKHAISYSGRYEKNNYQSTTEPADELSLLSTNSCHRQDTFCAALVLRFYKHMGWVDADRAVNSVMPCDFDIIDQKTNPNICPVHFCEELGCSFGPPELVVCPDLGATLPLRLPKREQL